MAGSALSRWLAMAGLLGATHHGLSQEVPSQLLGDLASEQFHRREVGQSGLLAWAKQHEAVAMDAIWNQYRNSPDPEVRQRCLAVLKELVTDRYLSEGSGFLGVGMSYGMVAPPGEIALVHAVLVTTVRQGTPASRAGIRAGDMIVRLDGNGWTNESSAEEFSERIAACKPGATVKLEWVRQGKWVEAEAVLVRRPASLQLFRFGIPGVDEAAEEQAAIDVYFKEWLKERNLRK